MSISNYQQVIEGEIRNSIIYTKLKIVSLFKFSNTIHLTEDVLQFCSRIIKFGLKAGLYFSNCT